MKPSFEFEVMMQHEQELYVVRTNLYLISRGQWANKETHAHTPPYHSEWVLSGDVNTDITYPLIMLAREHKWE